MTEPVLVHIINDDLIEITKEAYEDSHDMFLINFENYSKKETKNKIKNIFEVLINEKKTTYLIFKNINEDIINSEEFLLLYDFSTALNIKLFRIE